MKTAFDAYANTLVAFFGVLLYLFCFGYKSVIIHKFCCMNFTLRGWGPNSLEVED